MKSQPITEDDLNSFVDGRIDPERYEDVASYLDAHPDVAQRISAYRDQAELLRAALAPIAEEPVPPELRLSHMLEDRRRLRRIPRWALASAAVILLCIGMGSGWMLHAVMAPPVRGITALVREAAANYSVYAPDQTHPVEFRAEDRNTLASLTTKRVGRPIAIPDLAASGYRFMGGRIVPSNHGPAALFMYDDDRGTRLVMLIRTMVKADLDTPMSSHAQGQLSSYAWSEGGIGYSLIGAISADLLRPVADDAQRQLRGSA